MSRYLRVFKTVVTIGGGSAIATTIYREYEKKREWLNQKLERISRSAETIGRTFKGLRLKIPAFFVPSDSNVETLAHANLPEISDEFSDLDSMSKEQLRSLYENVLQELLDSQKKHKGKLDILDKENEELKQEIQALIEARNTKRPPKRKSLVEQYGEILDTLSSLDASSGAKHSLPMVVVVGDQSSGKTSVLEYIARARIFPRGSGEMMTRAPVMVTTSESIVHEAQFAHDSRVYALDSEEDLRALRKELEEKMNAIAASGKTVSSEPISLSMRGPGLPRMVLVDLPGIINTVTSDLNPDSKDAIIGLAKSYMSNPNAIILCVQDGSVDAERSLVTELVGSIDPTGSRTLCVLTKLDVAERNCVKLERVQRLLSGRLFPMRALNYFAVIAGTGDPESSIAQISAHEETFFRSSTLFRDGAIKPSQATAENLVAAVSSCFWEMVRGSVEREAEALRSRLLALTAEWNHRFSGLRELDREELFERARADVMDDAIVFCNTHAREWEERLSRALWKTVMPRVFREIYLKNALTSSEVGFKTQTEILLQQWLTRDLTDESIEAAKSVMLEMLSNSFSRPHPQYANTTYTDLFRPLRAALLTECSENFHFLDYHIKNLRIIQRAALSDETVNDRVEWEQACSLMENVLSEGKADVSRSLTDLTGPSRVEQWLYWTNQTTEQFVNAQVFDELTKLQLRRESRVPSLSSAESATLVQSLRENGANVKPEALQPLWDYVYLLHFYKESLEGVQECRKLFRRGDFSSHRLGCNDIVLFFKVHKLLQQTVVTLRQQIAAQEARRLENFFRDVLDTYSTDDALKKQLFCGRQVELAVEIKRVFEVKHKLEKFIETLLRSSPS